MVGLKEMESVALGKEMRIQRGRAFHLFPPALVSAMVMTPGVKEGCQQRARLKDRTPRVAYHKQQMEMWPKIKKGETNERSERAGWRWHILPPSSNEVCLPLLTGMMS